LQCNQAVQVVRLRDVHKFRRALGDLGRERRGRTGVQCRSDSVEHGLRFHRLDQDGGHAASFGRGVSLVHAMRRRVEDDGCVRNIRFGAHAAGKLDAAHDRHRQVGNDQVRMLCTHDRKGLGAIRRLQNRVTDMAEQCGQEITIYRAIVNDQDRRHWRLRRRDRQRTNWRRGPTTRRSTSRRRCPGRNGRNRFSRQYL
jgi:hypothetical protein